MMLAEPATRGAIRPYLLIAVLTLSLALNLFFVIGAAWIHVHAPTPMLSSEDRLEKMAGELNLNPEQKQAFGLFAQAMRQHLEAMHRAVQPLIGDAWSEVAKPQANEDKVMQFFDEADQKRRGFMRDLTMTTLSFLATLTPEQRARFVQLAHQRPRPWSPPPDHRGAR
jgi:Spy/CpxP family protein refolding chaperone